MKTIFTIVICLLFCSSNIKAQDIIFNRIGGDTTYTNVSWAYAYAYFKNNTNNPIELRFERIVNELPNPLWASAICYGSCYGQEDDIVPPLNEPPILLQPGQQDTMDVTMTCPNDGIAYVVLKLFDVNNPSNFVQANFWTSATIVSIQQISTIVEDYKLSQNYPNPFNPSTIINFSIPKNEKVNLKVYDMLGNEVANLLNNESLGAGSYNYEFNAGNYNLTSGVYFYKLTTSDFTDIKKMMLVK